MADQCRLNPPRRSRPDELMRDAVVAGQGDPDHVPSRAVQTYYDLLGGVWWDWYAGQWHERA